MLLYYLCPLWSTSVIHILHIAASVCRRVGYEVHTTARRKADMLRANNITILATVNIVGNLFVQASNLDNEAVH